MEINYIILAHKNPKQVQRLINRIDTPNCNFYIHIDKAVDEIPFFKALAIKPNTFFVSDNLREYGTWGDIGLVKATLACLRNIALNKRNGYCILMSGQDYPLKKNQFINDFLKINYGDHFIATFPLPHSGWGNLGGLDRLNQYKIKLSNTKMDFVQLPSLFDKTFYKKQTIGKIKKLLNKKHFSCFQKLLLIRKSPIKIKHYGGGQWWAFPIETIKKILHFIDTNPKYLNYHEYTLIPDEIFFHSILMYLKEKDEKIIIKPSITYVNWERKKTLLPVTFTKEDMEELKSASENKLFARKFDMSVDVEILNIIDKEFLI